MIRNNLIVLFVVLIISIKKLEGKLFKKSRQLNSCAFITTEEFESSGEAMKKDKTLHDGITFLIDFSCLALFV